jgi:transposase
MRHEALPQLTGKATRLAFDSDYETVLAVKVRRDRLDAEIGEMAADSEFTPLRLGCLRGVSTLTGFGLARSRSATGTGSPATPSARSWGWCRVNTPWGPRGFKAITKAANTHARRLLVEAAWHHRARYVVGKTMRDRWELAPAAARARGDEGNRRLHHRWAKYVDRRKEHDCHVAIARGLAGWCWSLAVMEE